MDADADADSDDSDASGPSHGLSVRCSDLQTNAVLIGETAVHVLRPNGTRLGRLMRSDPNTDVPDRPRHVDVYLDPCKLLSRHHMDIRLDAGSGVWELRVHGKNGVAVNGTLVRPQHGPVLLAKR